LRNSKELKEAAKESSRLHTDFESILDSLQIVTAVTAVESLLLITPPISEPYAVATRAPGRAPRT